MGRDMTTYTGSYGPAPSLPAWRPVFGNRWAAVAITVLAFAAWWPLGLAMLALLIGSKRMNGGNRLRRSAGRDWAQSAWSTMCREAAPSSGNHAFDEYRAETLRRLEDEQKEFTAFLERLRYARDKSEFDAFMTERRQRPETPPEPA